MDTLAGEYDEEDDDADGGGDFDLRFRFLGDSPTLPPGRPPPPLLSELLDESLESDPLEDGGGCG